MEKIGVFGGTFNPIHNGHLFLAEHYINALKLERLLVIPTKQPPHKQTPDLLSADCRLRLCKQAFAGIKQAQVSDMEIVRSGKSYTVDTVRELKQTFSDSVLYLLVGSDMFLTFREWKDWQEILSNVVLCTAARNPGEMKRLQACAREMKDRGEVMVFDFPVFPVSSTQIRKALKAGQNCSGLLPESVYQTILQENLYREEP